MVRHVWSLQNIICILYSHYSCLKHSNICYKVYPPKQSETCFPGMSHASCGAARWLVCFSAFDQSEAVFVWKICVKMAFVFSLFFETWRVFLSKIVGLCSLNLITGYKTKLNQIGRELRVQGAAEYGKNWKSVIFDVFVSSISLSLEYEFLSKLQNLISSYRGTPPIKKNMI